jgi:hypothetical protein
LGVEALLRLYGCNLLPPHVDIGGARSEAAVLGLESLDPLLEVIGSAACVGGQALEFSRILGVALFVDTRSETSLEVLDGVDLVLQRSCIILYGAYLIYPCDNETATSP